MSLYKDILRNRKLFAALSAILVLGSVLRFHGLDNQSLWMDELASWSQSHYDDLSTVINEGVRPDVHPPGYQILLYFVEQYLGDSESALRVPSAVSGVLSIFAIFLIAVRLYSYKEGVIAAALMAVLLCPIYYSQEARPHSMLLLFTQLATYFWISILQRIDDGVSLSRYEVLGYVTTATICSYLHYFGLYLVALQGLGALLLCARRHRAVVEVSLSYLLILVAYLPWLPAMLEDLAGGPTWIGPPTNTAFFEFLLWLFNHSTTIVAVVMVLYLFPLALRGYSALKGGRVHNMSIALLSPGLLLLLWLIVPFSGAYVTSTISTPVLVPKNLIISLPAAYLLLSHSISCLPCGTKGQSIVTVGIVGLLLFDLVFSMDYYSAPHKDQFREAVDYIVERDHLYVDSLIIGWGSDPNYFNYYFERSGSIRRIDATAGNERDIRNIGRVIASKRPRYIWYIVRTQHPLDPEFIDYLSQNFTLIGEKRFAGLAVWLFGNEGTTTCKPARTKGSLGGLRQQI